MFFMLEEKITCITWCATGYFFPFLVCLLHGRFVPVQMTLYTFVAGFCPHSSTDLALSFTLTCFFEIPICVIFIPSGIPVIQKTAPVCLSLWFFVSLIHSACSHLLKTACKCFLRKYRRLYSFPQKVHRCEILLVDTILCAAKDVWNCKIDNKTKNVVFLYEIFLQKTNSTAWILVN